MDNQVYIWLWSGGHGWAASLSWAASPFNHVIFPLLFLAPLTTPIAGLYRRPLFAWGLLHLPGRFTSLFPILNLCTGLHLYNVIPLALASPPLLPLIAKSSSLQQTPQSSLLDCREHCLIRTLLLAAHIIFGYLLLHSLYFYWRQRHRCSSLPLTCLLPYVPYPIVWRWSFHSNQRHP